MTRARLVTAIAAVCLLAACRSESTTEPAPEQQAETPAAAAPDDDSDDRCAITRARELIEGVVLENDDGTCRVYLSGDAAAGALDVRVSAAGDATAAAVERDGDEGTLYANSGTVTLTTVEPGRWVGSFEAEDRAAPATGVIAGAIDVTASP